VSEHRAGDLVRRFPRLNALFFALIAVMAAHQGEHVAQVVQKDALYEQCPHDCRGVLGFIFDVEWIHFAYNTSILLALIGLFTAYRMWRPEWVAAAPGAWLLLFTATFVVQVHHVIEHSVKLVQWQQNGHVSPQPGLLGQLLPVPHGRNFSLIELHFVFNTVVFVCVVAAYFMFGFHRELRFRARRLSWVPATAVAVPLVASAGLAWAAGTPTVHLSPGVHRGPLVIDSAQKLVGKGAVVRGGIVITSNNVTLRDVTVVGGEHGITVDGARFVMLDNVTVRGAALDGIHVRRSSVVIRKCSIDGRGQRWAQGIDISFSADLAPSVVRGCTIVGGQEGIVTHSAHAMLTGNHVSRTTLRGITMTEMSMGAVERNHVSDALGVGIFCGDSSECSISENRVSGTRADRSTDDSSRRGFGIVADFGASAKVSDNELSDNPEAIGAFAQAQVIEHR
jgi:parallel beta-helix repeat protein